MSTEKPTTPIEAYRAITPAERVAVGCALHDFAFQRMVLHLQKIHPEKSERQILITATKSFLGNAAGVLKED